MREQSKTNILIATGIYPPQIGGPATYSKLLVDRLPKQGFNVRLVNFGSVIRFPKFIRHFLFFLKVLKQGLWADTVYAQDPVSVGLPALIVASFLRKRMILKVVGDYAWEQGVQYHGVKDLLDEFLIRYKEYSWKVRLLKKIQAFVARKSQCVIVPSRYLKKVVVQWGIDQNNIFIINNTFSPPLEIETTREILRSKYGFTGKTILSAGRIVPWKGFGILIDLMPEILNKIEGAHLVIVGEGPFSDILVDKINQKRLGHKIKMFGRASHTEILQMLKAADVFVLNTSYEGFSHIILEAMSLGTPVVTTNVGGNSEIIVDGKNGFLTGYNDTAGLEMKIIRVLSKQFDDKNIRQEAKKTAESFDEVEMINQLKELLKKA